MGPKFDGARQTGKTQYNWGVSVESEPGEQ